MYLCSAINEWTPVGVLSEGHGQALFSHNVIKMNYDIDIYTQSSYKFLINDLYIKIFEYSTLYKFMHNMYP